MNNRLQLYRPKILCNVIYEEQLLHNICAFPHICMIVPCALGSVLVLSMYYWSPIRRFIYYNTIPSEFSDKKLKDAAILICVYHMLLTTPENSFYASLKETYKLF
jgi:hypothetical protein